MASSEEGTEESSLAKAVGFPGSCLMDRIPGYTGRNRDKVLHRLEIGEGTIVRREIEGGSDTPLRRGGSHWDPRASREEVATLKRDSRADGTELDAVNDAAAVAVAVVDVVGREGEKIRATAKVPAGPSK